MDFNPLWNIRVKSLNWIKRSTFLGCCVKEDDGGLGLRRFPSQGNLKVSIFKRNTENTQGVLRGIVNILGGGSMAYSE